MIAKYLSFLYLHSFQYNPCSPAQKGPRTGLHVCVHGDTAFCGHIKLMSTYACPNETRFKGWISVTRLFHGMNNLYQHFYINVNNVFDVMAIKQFLCCATGLNHKSLLNEILSVFFSTVQLLLFTSFGYKVTKKVETFWTIVNISIS